jgi:hypothetical protein
MSIPTSEQNAVAWRLNEVHDPVRVSPLPNRAVRLDIMRDELAPARDGAHRQELVSRWVTEAGHIVGIAVARVPRGTPLESYPNGVC